MKKVLILAFGHTVASTFTGPMDVFHQAGSLFNRLTGEKEAPRFDVKLVSLDGKPFETLSGMTVMPHLSMAHADQADLVVISALSSLDSRRYPGAIEWIKRHAEQSTAIASVCTGAFLLAATGLLDGKTATTHWAFAEEFRQRYPAVHLQPEKIITDEGKLFCSGGFTAGMDLALYLVERYCGPEVAIGSAKAMVYDLNRVSQTPYSVFRLLKNHDDAAILNVQIWLENHFAEKISYPDLAGRFGLTTRTLERRFQAATGITPLYYLRKVRIEAARRLLEESGKSFDEISWEVGYGNSGFLRKVFVQETGLHPPAYRRRFRRR